MKKSINPSYAYKGQGKTNVGASIQNPQQYTGQNQTSGSQAMHRKNKKSHYVVSDTNQIFDLQQASNSSIAALNNQYMAQQNNQRAGTGQRGSILDQNQQKGPQMRYPKQDIMKSSHGKMQGYVGTNIAVANPHQALSMNNLHQNMELRGQQNNTQNNPNNQLPSQSSVNFYQANDEIQAMGIGGNQQARTQVNSNLHSINSSGGNQGASKQTNQNLQMKINKKRIMSSGKQPNKAQTGMTSIIASRVSTHQQSNDNMMIPHHQRIQSNPIYINGATGGLTASASGLRSQQSLQEASSPSVPMQNFQMNPQLTNDQTSGNQRYTAQKPMVLPKTQNSTVQRKSVAVKQSVSKGNENQPNFTQALNTLGANNELNVSRQEAVGVDSQFIGKMSKNKAQSHHQKAMSMSSYMINPKKLNATNQYSIANKTSTQVGNSISGHPGASFKQSIGIHKTYDKSDPASLKGVLAGQQIPNGSQTQQRYPKQKAQSKMTGSLKSQTIQNSSHHAAQKSMGVTSDKMGLVFNQNPGTIHTAMQQSPKGVIKNQPGGISPLIKPSQKIGKGGAISTHKRQDGIDLQTIKSLNTAAVQNNLIHNPKKKMRMGQGTSTVVNTIQGGHRRNQSDQQQFYPNGQLVEMASYGNQRQGHNRAATGVGVMSAEENASNKEQLEQANAAGGRIVVINNNNTNINIHHQGNLQGLVQFPNNGQSYYPMYQQQQQQQQQQQNVPDSSFAGTKSYTHANHSIRNSFNNSAGGGLEDSPASRTPANFEQNNRSQVRGIKTSNNRNGLINQTGDGTNRSSSFRQSIHSRGGSRGKTLSKGPNQRGVMGSMTGDNRDNAKNIIGSKGNSNGPSTLVTKNSQGTHQIVINKQSQRRMIKEFQGNKQPQLKQNKGDNNFISSERSSLIYNQNSAKPLQEQFKDSKNATQYQSSSAALLDKNYNEEYGLDSQGHGSRTQAQKQNIQGLNSVPSVDTFENNMYVIKQQNNFVHGGVDSQGQMPKKSNIIVQAAKHQKKASAGAALSKGQRQLKQILSNQQQMHMKKLSNSPSKQSGVSLLGPQGTNAQALNSFHHSHAMNSLTNSQANFYPQSEQVSHMKIPSAGNATFYQQPNVNRGGAVQRTRIEAHEQIDPYKNTPNRMGSSKNSVLQDKKTKSSSNHNKVQSQSSQRLQDGRIANTLQNQVQVVEIYGDKVKGPGIKTEPSYTDLNPSHVGQHKNQLKVQAKNLNVQKQKAKDSSKLSHQQHSPIGKQVMRGSRPMTAKSSKPRKQSHQDDEINMTPRQQIYNTILDNIRNGLYETKTEYYKIGKVIGKGAFGKVNLAIHRLTGKFVALKSISKAMMKMDETSMNKVRQEYKILKKARQANIVRLYESFDTESHIVYVMEVCGGGDLLTYVRRRRKLKEDHAKFLFKQIVKGLQYVHSKGVLHRDIKLDNILLTSEGDVKICDFGVSKLVNNPNATQTEQCGTPAYIAPEVFRGKGYKGFQSDIWSAGVVLYAMLYGTVPFKATNMVELQQQILNVQCSWGAAGDISASALEMLKKILEADPKKRLTPQQIFSDPWMQQTDAQGEGVQVFSDYEKVKIVQEFEYYNKKKEGEVDKQDDPFLEQMLVTTQNSIIKNNTTKSVILAPFNSTKSHISENFFMDPDIQSIMIPKEKDVLVFKDKCREINRQYMLNNNAELDNGVYNEDEHEKQEDKAEQEDDDGLVGMNQQILSNPKEDNIMNENVYANHKNEKPGSSSNPNSNPQSNFQSGINSLNTSIVNVDEEKIMQLEQEFGYPQDYVTEQIENDELDHATTTYFLIDQMKEF